MNNIIPQIQAMDVKPYTVMVIVMKTLDRLQRKLITRHLDVKYTLLRRGHSSVKLTLLTEFEESQVTESRAYTKPDQQITNCIDRR